MKIALAQTWPLKGDLLTNIGAHVYYVHQAAERRADIIFFSELSLTGYEPKLAHVLATDQDNPHFDIFQEEADRYNITICAGVPVKAAEGIWIGMVIFSPNSPRRTYGKKYIHPDEVPYFVPGPTITPLLVSKTRIAPAICYELSCPEHIEHAVQQGADVYLASVAKTVEGNERAYTDLARISAEHEIPSLLVNCVGPAGGSMKVGGSAIWDASGKLVENMSDQDEGLLIYDMTDGTVEVVNL
jgi:predicted amidohydrolase